VYNCAMLETAKNKPKISAGARRRIREFVTRIEELQKEFSVEICTQDDSIVFRDVLRTDDWQGYGYWDASIFDTQGKYRMRVRNIRFEEFSLWGK